MIQFNGKCNIFELNFESKVYEFTEQVNELKNKLADDIQDKLGKTSESETESKQLNEMIELENKYSTVTKL